MRLEAPKLVVKMAFSLVKRCVFPQIWGWLGGEEVQVGGGLGESYCVCMAVERGLTVGMGPWYLMAPESACLWLGCSLKASSTKDPGSLMSKGL